MFAREGFRTNFTVRRVRTYLTFPDRCNPPLRAHGPVLEAPTH